MTNSSALVMRVHQDPFRNFTSQEESQSPSEELTSGSYWQVGALNVREN